MPKVRLNRRESETRTAGLVAFNKQRKLDSREKLLASAIDLFCRNGYGAVGIEDITAAAGVSRVTFYRHFADKSAMAMELFRQASEDGAPRMLAIAAMDYRDHAAIVQWLVHFFARDRDMRGILRVLRQANVEEADFARRVQPFIPNLIVQLGKTIPAFMLDPQEPSDQKQWVKAWLLIYTILDQSNHAATDSGIARTPFMIEVLADSFLDFVRGHVAPV